MKCRVFRKQDGGVVYNWPSKNWQDKVEECPIPADLEGLDFIVLDLEELPREDSLFYHEQLHFDGPLSKENLKVDSSWDKQLMPNFLIKEKHLKKINQKLDAELEKVDPDMAEVVTLNRKKEKIEYFNDLQMLELALEGLNERVTAGELDKPTVRQKLNNKINQLRRG